MDELIRARRSSFFSFRIDHKLCKSQRHFVSAAAAILKEVSLGLNLIQSRCGCTVVCHGRLRALDRWTKSLAKMALAHVAGKYRVPCKFEFLKFVSSYPFPTALYKSDARFARFAGRHSCYAQTFPEDRGGVA